MFNQDEKRRQLDWLRRILPHPKSAFRLASFKYKALSKQKGEIRVLTLHPGLMSDEIEISMRHKDFTVTDTPAYEAPNYT